MARRHLIAGIVATLLVPTIGLAQTCPGGMNKAEIGTRYLVTEFMVAALACKNDPAFRDAYTSFVRRYNPGLVSNAQAMRRHFGGGSALDSFVTRLANHAALRQNDSTYCQHARLRIDRALGTGKNATLAQVIDGLGYAQGGPACGDMTPVAALTGKDRIGSQEKTAPAKPTPTRTVAAPAAASGEPAAAAPPMPAAGGTSDLSPSP